MSVQINVRDLVKEEEGGRGYHTIKIKGEGRTINSILSEYDISFSELIQANKYNFYTRNDNEVDSSKLYPAQKISDEICNNLTSDTASKLSKSTTQIELKAIHIGKGSMVAVPNGMLTTNSPEWTIFNNFRKGDYFYYKYLVFVVLSSNSDRYPFKDEIVRKAYVTNVDVYVRTLTIQCVASAESFDTTGSYVKLKPLEEQLSVAEYLKTLGRLDKIKDIDIMIPIRYTGGLSESTTTPTSFDGAEQGGEESTGLEGNRLLSEDTSGSVSIHDSWVTIYEQGTAKSSMYLPIFPNEFTDSNQGSFSVTSILGRSVSYQTYNSSSRSVDINLDLHEELCSDYMYVHRLVAAIESANYPGYGEGVVSPPEISLTVGRHLQIRGVLTNCSASWSAPIIDGMLVHCNLNLSITETTGPYSREEVARNGAFRGI